MIECHSKCHNLAPSHLTEVEQGGERVRSARIAVRCNRPHCGGQLYLDAEYGAHLFSLTCILCARTATTLTAIDLVERFGVTWEQLQAATWNGATFLWHRIEVAAP